MQLSCATLSETRGAARKPTPGTPARRALPLLGFIAALSLWPAAGFAQLPRQQIDGPPPPVNTTLTPAGSTYGVDMVNETGTGTLLVPDGSNIFTNNVSLISGTPAVTTSANSTGNMQFLGSSTVYGAIGMTEPVGPYLLGVTAGANGSTVNFLGPINDTTTVVSGTGTLNLDAATNQSPGGLIFNGDGTVALAAGTYVNAAGGVTTAAGTNTGTLVLGGGSYLDGAVGAGAAALRNITVTGGNNNAGVSATINGAVNVYSFNLATNTLNVTGALTIADSTANGVINTTLASPALYGAIRPVGTTNLGTTVTVNVTIPASAIIPVGTTFYIVKTNGSQTGTPGTIVNVVDLTDPSSRFTGLDFGAGLIEITSTQAFLGPVAITAGTTPAPGSPIVPASPGLAAPVEAFQATREFEGLWLSHLDEIMCGQVEQRRPSDPEQPSTCTRNEPHSGWWMKGFGYWGSQGARDGFAGYDSQIAGTEVGVDTPVPGLAFGGETRVGFGLGYAWTGIDGRGTPANTDSSTYTATVYIAHEQGPLFIDGDLSFGWNDYSQNRNVTVPGLLNSTAQADYSGQEYTAFAVTGYHFYTGGFTLTPLASLQYTHMTLGGYTETGAAPLNLTVSSQSYDFVESGLGGTAARPFRYAGGTLVPEVHLKWFHELANPRIRNTWSAPGFTGATSFVTTGPATGGDTLNPGIGVTFLSCACTGKTWSLEAVYDYFWRSDSYAANQIMLRFTARF
jgi:outer membrane autotransporter protein